MDRLGRCARPHLALAVVRGGGLNTSDAHVAIDALLGAARSAAAAGIGTPFDDATRGREIVLVGAGNLGRHVGRVLRAGGRVPAAFTDGNPRLHGTSIDGMPVLSPANAVRAYADAAFIICIWGARSSHRIADTAATFRASGAAVVLPFTLALWRYPDGLPHYLVDDPRHALAQADAIHAAADAWYDDRSREEYIAQLRARLTGDLTGLANPERGPAYLAPVFRPRRDDVVVDGGAYDGDTLRDWLSHAGTMRRWIAFEPDPISAARFRESASTLSPEPNWTLHPAALGERDGRGVVVGAGAESARVRAGAAGDGNTVPVVALDAMPMAAPPTFIKLDVEGAELDALSGMSETIREHRPVVAACVYHAIDHLWRVPLAIRAMMPDARFHLRAHGAEGWDLVCYAVPPERS